MTATDILKHEHELILRVLDAAEAEWQTAEATGAVHADVLDKLLDFFRNFADRCHHAKEEQQLFVRLRQRGLPAEGGPVGVMLSEHEAGRQYLQAVAAALPAAHEGDTAAIDAIRHALGGYITLLRAHIAKENNILFPMADRVLRVEDQHELSMEFERMEAEEISEGVHEKYHHLAQELSAV